MPSLHMCEACSASFELLHPPEPKQLNCPICGSMIEGERSRMAINVAVGDMEGPATILWLHRCLTGAAAGAFILAAVAWFSLSLDDPHAGVKYFLRLMTLSLIAVPLVGIVAGLAAWWLALKDKHGWARMLALAPAGVVAGLAMTLGVLLTLRAWPW